MTFTQHANQQDHSLSEKYVYCDLWKCTLYKNICKCDTYCRKKCVNMSETFSNGRLNLKQKQTKRHINVESFYCWSVCLVNPRFEDCLKVPERNKYLSLLMKATCFLVCILNLWCHNTLTDFTSVEHPFAN